MNLPVLTVEIRYENDVVFSRQRARQIAGLIGFDEQDQVRIATAVSELARNAFRYAGSGRIAFAIEGNTAPQALYIQVSDRGTGIKNLQQILDGQYKSDTGMGLGLLGVRKLMDGFDIQSSCSHGTTIEVRKLLPPRVHPLTTEMVAKIADELARDTARNPFEEIQLQNQELIRTLNELRQKQEDLARLNAELEDTNRGVLALYAEIDEKADHLHRADELKSRFLSNMSHEFRTPLNSILALTRLLLGHSDGPLSDEQAKQVQYIRKGAQELSELVNDLLDLAKVEAGKVDIKPTTFTIESLFGALRGMLKPLLLSESVRLVFEDPRGIPVLHTDEAKVSQIIRNFISNALKFTERGEVRISVELGSTGKTVLIHVADTGIGIAPSDQERIFQEFTQIDNSIQRKVKGTGLGLPLSKKLAELLGGTVSVQSETGKGSIFTFDVPIQYIEKSSQDAAVVPLPSAPGLVRLLIVEDTLEDKLIYEKIFRKTQFGLRFAESIEQARRAMRHDTPLAIILDAQVGGLDTCHFLAEIKSNPQTRSIPVIIVGVLEGQQKEACQGANDYILKPIERVLILHKLEMLLGQRTTRTILLIDDEESARYIIKKGLTDPHHIILEANNADTGLKLAKINKPDVILLDLAMPLSSGFEVLEQLKSDPETLEIPVIIHSSQVLTESERKRLAAAVTIVPKGTEDSIAAIWAVLLKTGLPKLLAEKE